MKADSHRIIETSLSPVEFLDRIRATTVPYETIMNFRAPVSGYADFVQHSFSGKKTVVAKVDPDSFMLMPIGMWPMKGQTPVANAGALYGTFEATATGTKITTDYRLGLGIVIFFFLIAAVSAGLVALVVAVTLLYPETEGLLLLQGLAAASVLFTLLWAVYYGLGGRQQHRILLAFLRELCEEPFAQEGPTPQPPPRRER